MSEKRGIWRVSDVGEILAGATDPRKISEKDRIGLTPVTYSAMEAARAANALMPLLELLEPTEAEQDKLQLLLDLLEKIADSQIRTERRLALLEQAVVGRRSAS
jgi:hypothetical protein